MLKKDKSDNFYNSLDKLSQKMESINNDIENKKRCIKSCLNEMSEQIEDISTAIPKNSNKDIQMHCDFVVKNLKNSLKEWTKEFENIIEKEEFRNEFRDSFLVIIYGKVKAGKSSFGNFIAYNALPSQKAKFFLYDKAGVIKHTAKLEELDSDTGFEVKRTEATKEIQGFRLSGLTWIDTPGLASMSPENEQLAKEYIESADLIIYPISSDAPGRSTDINEIIELLTKNKRVNIIITKSDKTSRAVENGEIVPIVKNKTNEDRRKQEEYVLDSIRMKLPPEKKHLIDDNIYSLSIKTAKIGLERNDIQLYNESNLDLFYEHMNTLLDSQAINLKIKAPLDKLKTYIEFHIIGDYNKRSSNTLNSIQADILEIENKRKKAISELENIFQILIGDIITEVENYIDKNYSTLNKHNSNKILEDILIKTQKKLSSKVTNEVNKVLENFDNSIIKFNLDLDPNSFKVEDKFSTIEYDDTEKMRKYGQIIAGGTGAGLAALAISNFWNPTGWIAGLGALVAETVAMNASGYIGEKIGEAFGEIKKEKVHIGDNKDEVLVKLKDEMYKSLEKELQKTQSTLLKYYFEPIVSFSKEVGKLLKKIELDMKGCIK